MGVGLLVFVSLVSLIEARHVRDLSVLVHVTGPLRSRGHPGGSRLLGSARAGAQAIAPPIGCAMGGGMIGFRILGPAGLVGGALAGWMLLAAIRRRRARGQAGTLERQLTEVVETAALAVRSGLSILQALEFSAAEVQPPMDRILQRLIDERRLGVPLEQCLQQFADTIDTDDARMFVLILSIHHRTGGNVAGALEEVSNAVRHRVAVRRELHALTAQGRVSGAILGALPIAFFLVLAASSQRELGPVYRSPVGIGMLTLGLGLEAIAYLWIRRLLRVEV